ncbi:hypothetical protein ACQ33O_06975 [Ferruginibacter sp. SUN002]|uniref:hypothetical protein n=1 Tax=Ferruginibacter sp. SUN002 TaxID=2937789 RepID=UPI003D35C4C9
MNTSSEEIKKQSIFKKIFGILGKDNFWYGCVLGLLAPFVGFILFKYRNLGPLTYWEGLQFIFVQPGHAILTAALSVSLLANAVIFTLFVNAKIDKTAKGIFAATCLYGVTILCLKFLI